MATVKETPTLSDSSRFELSLAGLRVLVIDDDEHVRTAMTALLEAWECLSRTADSGSAAASIVTNSNFKPDLIVADFRLRHHQTGADVIHQLREILGRVIPAIIMTGETNPDRVREIEDSGIDVLQKPVDEKQLRSMISRVLIHAD
jgi:DNA-binding NtrC family response regulator